MPKHSRPRKGSLQFYPRKRSKKTLPRVNWNTKTKSENGLLGFIGYKVGMKTAFVKDNSAHSHTKGKRIPIPITIIECPTIKILSVRFYKENKVLGEVWSQQVDKELKKKVKAPKKINKKIEDFKEYDDVRLIVYSQVKKTGIKKKPDIIELGMSGSKEEKLETAKNLLNKEISVSQVFNEGLIDIHGVTKGKGTQGPTKRFGLRLRFHKSEKGVRGPGSGGPWHPARVEFTQPMAGQMGYHKRVTNNKKIISIANINDNDINTSKGFKHYGKVRSDYIILSGSVQGPVKRQLVLVPSQRPSKPQTQKKYELIELR